jgi:hypothetical protein
MKSGKWKLNATMACAILVFAAQASAYAEDGYHPELTVTGNRFATCFADSPVSRLAGTGSRFRCRYVSRAGVLQEEIPRHVLRAEDLLVQRVSRTVGTTSFKIVPDGTILMTSREGRRTPIRLEAGDRFTSDFQVATTEGGFFAAADIDQHLSLFWVRSDGAILKRIDLGHTSRVMLSPISQVLQGEFGCALAWVDSQQRVQLTTWTRRLTSIDTKVLAQGVIRPSVISAAAMGNNVLLVLDPAQGDRVERRRLRFIPAALR